MATLAPVIGLAPRPARAGTTPGLRWYRRVPAWREAADLAIDLGDAIGSARWWQGLATLGGLVAGVVALALLPAPRMPEAPGRPILPSVRLERSADRIAALGFGSATGRRAPPTQAVRRLAEPPEKPRITLSGSIGSGGSLTAALRRAGVGREDLALLLPMVRTAVDPERLKPGTALELVLGRRETRAVPRPLEYLAFRAAFDLRLEIERAADGLRLRRIPIAVDNTPLRLGGTVGRSLHRALRTTGVPAGVVADFLRQMGHVVDIQRDIRGKDRFDLVVEHRRAETGEREWGRLLYAGLRDGRREIALMRFGPKGEFFRENGESAKRGLIRTPVDGARLSSGFGMRFHPILGYSRMHQGLDFAAPTGTPVLASAAGRVVMAGWGGGYGNLVEIDHGRGMRTRYAHLSRIRVKPGQQVGQGATIGAVGSTGLSTGPHLHYEVWVNGKPVNPREARYLAGTTLAGAELARFRAEMARLRALPVAG
ncbi:M23 family metallopeptidase [Thermaurantiacus sp.]